MSNPMGSVRGGFIAIAQEEVDDSSKMRYAILNSDTLNVRKVFTGEGARDQLAAEVTLIENEYAAAVKQSTFAKLLAEDKEAKDAE